MSSTICILSGRIRKSVQFHTFIHVLAAKCWMIFNYLLPLYKMKVLAYDKKTMVLTRNKIKFTF